MAIIIVETEPGILIRIDEETAKKNGWTEFKRQTVESKPANNKALKPKAKEAKEATEHIEPEIKELD
jgi:hypothetical protein